MAGERRPRGPRAGRDFFKAKLGCVKGWWAPRGVLATVGDQAT